MSIESITIETATACNAKCIICPNQFKPRFHYIMPLDEFKRILLFFPKLKNVVLCGMYEPLIDPRLDRILNIIEQIQPLASITIFTNGSMLSIPKAKIILSHPNFRDLVVSIHGYSKEIYESIMVGIKREQVYQNVLNFVEMRNSLLSPASISVSFVRIKQNIHELEEFRTFWKKTVDVVSDYEVMNWRGAVPEAILLYDFPKHTRPCPMFDQPLVIDAYGQIVRCCYDFSFNYGHVLDGGFEKWLNKKRETSTFPCKDCEPCLGWKHY